MDEEEAGVEEAGEEGDVGDAYEVVSAVLQRDEQGRFKIMVKQDADGQIFLSQIGEIAKEDDRAILEEGDLLEGIDGSAIDGLTLVEVRDAIKSAGETLLLHVLRPSSSPPDEPASPDPAAPAGDPAGDVTGGFGAPSFAAFDVSFDAVDFDSAGFDAALNAADSSGAFMPSPPPATAAEQQAADAAFTELESICEESQASHRELIICCAVYKAEMCNLESEVQSRLSSSGGGAAEARLRKRNVELEAQLREAKAALAQEKEKTVLLNEHLEAAVASAAKLSAGR
uniref:PDZ domain-containing protein n=1 Tax=Haptolina ericina TaxID=156174 RepID=A0A7S3B1A1_9EUKA